MNQHSRCYTLVQKFVHVSRLAAVLGQSQSPEHLVKVRMASLMFANIISLNKDR